MPRPYPDSAKRENFCGGWDFQKAQEMEQLRAEIAATEAETATKSAMVIHKNAKSGIAAMANSQQQVTKLAKNGLGRELKK